MVQNLAYFCSAHTLHDVYVCIWPISVQMIETLIFAITKECMYASIHAISHERMCTSISTECMLMSHFLYELKVILWQAYVNGIVHARSCSSTQCVCVLHVHFETHRRIFSKFMCALKMVFILGLHSKWNSLNALKKLYSFWMSYFRVHMRRKLYSFWMSYFRIHV